MYVVTGRLQARLGGRTSGLGPGEGFHALPYQPHQVTALEDTLVIRSNNTIDGVGHKIKD